MKKKEFIRIISSILLLMIALFVPNSIIKIFLFGISYFIIGIDVCFHAIKSLKSDFLLDEHFLMSIATIGAFIIGEYPEAIMVMVLYQIGELFTDHAVEKSKEEIGKLMQIRPDYANLIKNGKEKKVKPEEVKVGDTILIKSGEKIPLDGVVLEGNSTLDTRSLTGESLPRIVKEQDMVLSGCINLNGTLLVEVTKEFQHSTVQKILELVENASSKKATSEKFITKFSKYYTPFVVTASFIIGIFVPFLFSLDYLDYIRRALIFLVISCPCALVISVPLGFFCGIGGASRKGILIKGSNYLEKLAEVDSFVFDKTGTLTKGSFKVVKVHSKKMKEQELVKVAAYSEINSSHPIALSIKNYYGKALKQKEVEQVTEKVGFGTTALFHNKRVMVGNESYMREAHVSIPKIHTLHTIVYVAIDGEYQGAIEISDEIKEEAKATIESLKQLGIQNCTMLTGDKEAIAKQVSHFLALDSYYAELLPTDKVKKVEELLEHQTVAFVGDGINDAPVLAMSDVGISMGNIGSDAAIEASDVVLMTDDLGKIVESLKIARKTLHIVKENIVFAIAIKVLILILGALGMASMWFAVLADVGVSILAILNSMRAFRL